MDKTEIEALAKDLIAEVAAERKDDQAAYKSENDGIVIFTFVVNTKYGESTFNYNPLAGAVKIVEDSKHWDEPERREHIKAAILEALKAAPLLFSDMLLSIPLLASAQKVRNDFGVFHDDLQENLSRSAVSIIERRLHERFGVKNNPPIFTPVKGRRAFNDAKAFNAIIEIGGKPTMYALAKKLKITPGAVRNWVKSKGCKNISEVVELTKNPSRKV